MKWATFSLYRTQQTNVNINLWTINNEASTVGINTKMTDCRTGVKQGCNLSPTLFSIFANDLVAEVNDLDIGIKVGDRKLSLLLYADDIVLVAESEEKLQSMLDAVHSWCKQWRV